MVTWTRSAWSAAVSPRAAPDGDLGVARVDGATITPFDRGRLRATAGAHLWMTGAVHDAEGRLVPESQRTWDGDTVAPVSADPEHVDLPEAAEQLAGTWVYAGHWTNHFGHFFVEPLANLWPDPDAWGGREIAGIVAHRSYRGVIGRGHPAVARPDLSTWQEPLVDLAGYAGGGVRIVRWGAVHVERLLVPARPVVLKSWAHPRAVEAWRRVAAGVAPAASPRVFMSRRLFHEQRPGDEGRVRVSTGWDGQLEQVFAQAGFHVVHPETLTIRRQLALVRGAEVLAGSSGSALHLSAFARPGTRVLEVGDARSPTRPMPTQAMVDAACAHRTAFVPYHDLGALRRVLRSL